MRDLTKTELRHIEREQNCPACGGDLLGGPEGGLSKNFKCAECQRIWNLAFAFGTSPPHIFAGQLVQGDDYLPEITRRFQELEDEEATPPPIDWVSMAVTGGAMVIIILLLIWLLYG